MHLPICCAVFSCSIRLNTCNPTDCSLPGSSVHGDPPVRISLPPGELPDPGIHPRSPECQADSLPAELPRKSAYISIRIGLLVYQSIEFKGCNFKKIKQIIY